MRLRADLERAWPLIAGAVRQAGGARLLSRVADALFELGSVLRPVGDRAVEANAHWDRTEEVLAELMTRDGLDLELACARAGYDVARVNRRAYVDPSFGARLAAYRSKAKARVHGVLWTMATADKEPSERAAMFLGERQFGMVSKVAVSEPDEADVLRSKAWGRIMTRLAGCLCEECSRTVGEELGRG